jgi:Amt family ammonium transporter
MGALVLGAAVGPLCLFFCSLFKNVLGYDDALDVFGIHGIGGAFGAIATGILVSETFGGVGVDGYNMVAQVITQLKGVVITVAWSGIGSLVIFLILSLTFGLRVSEDAEREGLDITEHGEQAYNY